MNVMRKALATLAAVALIGTIPSAQVVPAQASQAAQPALILPATVKYKFKNCKALNKVYRHGVGKATAKDKTSGKRVTNFRHDTKLYKKIVGYRRGLDRDHDGIACEKH